MLFTLQELLDDADFLTDEQKQRIIQLVAPYHVHLDTTVDNMLVFPKYHRERVCVYRANRQAPPEITIELKGY